MVAVIVTYEKSEAEDKIAYKKIKAEDLVNHLSPDMDISFNAGHYNGEVFLFDTEEEAERCMGAK